LAFILPLSRTVPSSYTLDVRATETGETSLTFDVAGCPTRKRNIFKWQDVAGQD
jgi:hypothetical protein